MIGIGNFVACLGFVLVVIGAAIVWQRREVARAAQSARRVQDLIAGFTAVEVEQVTP